MKCPYCAEDIKDEAIVCRFCHRDLGFFRPIAERLATVERRVDEIHTTIDALRLQQHQALLTQVNAGKYEAVSYSGRVIPLVTIAFVVAALASLSMISAKFDMLILGIVLAPLPLGMWLKFTRPATRWRSYLLLGLAFGAVEVLIFILRRTVRFGQGWAPDDTWGAPLGTLVYGIISFLLIAAGTVVGDWIARWLSRRASPRLAQQIAVKIVGSESGGYGPSVGDDRVRRLAAVISALGPLLALVGSVVTAYFTYLAAITKVVTK